MKVKVIQKKTTTVFRHTQYHLTKNVSLICLSIDLRDYGSYYILPRNIDFTHFDYTLSRYIHLTILITYYQGIIFYLFLLHITKVHTRHPFLLYSSKIRILYVFLLHTTKLFYLPRSNYPPPRYIHFIRFFITHYQGSNTLPLPISYYKGTLLYSFLFHTTRYYTLPIPITLYQCTFTKPIHFLHYQQN